VLYIGFVGRSGANLGEIGLSGLKYENCKKQNPIHVYFIVYNVWMDVLWRQLQEFSRDLPSDALRIK